jgi:hypothetical protein
MTTNQTPAEGNVSAKPQDESALHDASCSLSESEKLLRFVHDLGWWLGSVIHAAGLDCAVVARYDGFGLRFGGWSINLSFSGDLDNPRFGSAVLETDIDGAVKFIDLDGVKVGGPSLFEPGLNYSRKIGQVA